MSSKKNKNKDQNSLECPVFSCQSKKIQEVGKISSNKHRRSFVCLKCGASFSAPFEYFEEL